MPRNISPAYIAALKASVLYPVIFVEATFVAETIYLWTGVGETSWNGQTWQGMGALLGVSTIEEGSTVEAKGMTLSLSGIDPVLLPECLNAFQVGLPVTVYLGLGDGSGNIIDSPAVVFAGYMDEPTIDSEAKSATISVACESKLLDLNTPIAYRYTNQDQQIFYPGDMFFSWVNAIQSVPARWDNPNGNAVGEP